MFRMWNWSEKTGLGTCHGLAKTGSEISQMRQTSWGDRDPSNCFRNSAKKISSCPSRCRAWCCFYSLSVRLSGRRKSPREVRDGWFLFSVQCPHRVVLACKQWEGGCDIIIITCVHMRQTSIHWSEMDEMMSDADGLQREAAALINHG